MKELSRYPRPNVAVDVAVLTVSPEGRLATLLIELDGEPSGLAVPGRFLRPDESVTDCAATALAQKAGLELPEASPELLRVFDDPARDPRGWTLSLAHYVAVPPSRVTGRLAPVDSLPRLLFDHGQIVGEAAERLRERYELHPDPGGLLEGPVTLNELRRLHEAVIGEPIARDTFRRRMEPQLEPYVEDGEHTSRSDGGRPARLWQVAPPKPTAPTLERVRLPRATR